MIKVIIFDFDGVITESNDIKTAAFAKLFENEPKGTVERIVDYHLKNAGVSRYDKFRYIYKNILNRPLSETEFEALCERFFDLVRDSVAACPYVKGAKEFLEEKFYAYSFFILSGTPEDELKKIIDKRNIKGFFKRIYGSPNNKADIVRDILRTEKIKPEDVLYVGDAMSDYRASVENGINFIARCGGDKSVFSEMDILKIKDLTPLSRIIETNWR